MVTTSQLAKARVSTEALMTSTCTCARSGGDGVFDENTGKYTPTSPTQVYEGKCKVRFFTGQPDDVDAQSQLLIEQRPVLSLPVEGSATVQIGDVFTITANPADPSLVGMQLRIAGIHAQTAATARRFPCEVISSGNV